MRSKRGKLEQLLARDVAFPVTVTRGDAGTLGSSIKILTPVQSAYSYTVESSQMSSNIQRCYIFVLFYYLLCLG